MDGEFVSVKAHRFGELQQSVMDAMVWIENPHTTTLRATIAKAFKDEKPQTAFSADHHIHRVLPICQDCFGRNISPPVVNAVTNFATKATMTKKRKKKQLDAAVAKNYRKGRKKS